MNSRQQQLEQGGVQPWSQGDFYPTAVITFTGHFNADGDEMYRSAGVIAYGHEVKGYEVRDAYQVAQALCDGRITREHWLTLEN